jgi:acyl-CoA ligase (AMP-forming) (exosortase A-associated)
MPTLVHQLLLESAHTTPERSALVTGSSTLRYEHLAGMAVDFSAKLQVAGIRKGDRIAIYAQKRPEVVAAMFGASHAGAVFVPVNPMLKAEQVAYILRDCNVRALVTTADGLDVLRENLRDCVDLHTVFVIDRQSGMDAGSACAVPWSAPTTPAADRTEPSYRLIDADMAAILYTSGSTGKPKGVVLSHRNIVAGATSVAEYLELTCDDRLLCVLPLSFDYGLNQITTAFLVGATAVLLDHLFPRDVINAVARHRITGLAAVPPLWIQLAELPWPPALSEHLRYITNSGGAMPRDTLARLRSALPGTRPYLMYGLTEAFRSTYLPPADIDHRPDSIGKAIPNAEVMVVRPDGTPCNPGEPGELVHRGVHVALGYWNDPAKTSERFRPAPGQPTGLTIPELAVWSGDTARVDEDGFIYFIGRRDEMIKTSGFRVSPTEVEETLYSSHLVGEAAAFGIPHRQLGQAIAVVATAAEGKEVTVDILRAECQKRLPVYMVPQHFEIIDGPLPRNPNGKIDRKSLATERSELFSK